MYKILTMFVTVAVTSIIMHIMCVNKKIIKHYDAQSGKDNEKASATLQEIFRTQELERQYVELKEKDRKIYFHTYYDNLTKLPNKACFIEKLSDLISSKSSANQLVLFFVNIDNFKDINYVHGYDYGDKILLLISEVLKVVIPQNSILFKWYRDEFLIIIENLNDKQEAIDIAKNIIYSF